jgi:glucose/arabinose dehydrogenase
MFMLSTKKIISFIVAVFLIVFLFWSCGGVIDHFYKPTKTTLQVGVIKNNPGAFVLVANKLRIPWEIAFLPDGDLLVTERPGTLKRIGKINQDYVINDVAHMGEGGLLGLAIHPQFAKNHWLYLYHTVVRFRYVDNKLEEETIIINNIPGGVYHDGGKIAFGPDGYLYITTGDAGNAKLAQDKSSLAGKILRLKDDGSIPVDNPFGNAVYSYGHRNSQGIAWDDKNQLWATEHGRSGILSGYDELNLIQKGMNYGWPVTQGDEQKPGMVSPIMQSGPDETWAPAGIAFLKGTLFFGGLRGESLYAVRISNINKALLIAYLQKKFGRIRAVVVGPDGYLYISTSNTDGRGQPQLNDDKIIRINLNVFSLN